MIINFNKIKFRPSLFGAETEIGDFNKQLAEILWNSRSRDCGEFALRLFDNPELEITEQEKEYIKSALGNLSQWARVPVLQALGELPE